MDDFYHTTNVRTYFWRPGNNFAKIAPPIKEVDPNLIPGHAVNNITVHGIPQQSKTWELPPIPNSPEEYRPFLHRLKESKPQLFEKYFTNPDVDTQKLLERLKDDQLTTYQSAFSPTDYVARKEWVKWSRSKLDTSRFHYQPTTYMKIYSRIDEIEEMTTLSKPLVWPHDHQRVKNKLRKILKTKKTSYYTQFCERHIAKMEENVRTGKTWKPPLDPYTLRKY